MNAAHCVFFKRVKPTLLEFWEPLQLPPAAPGPCDLVFRHDRAGNRAEPQVHSEPQDVVANVITADDSLRGCERIFCRDAARAQIDIQILEFDRPETADRRLDAAAGGPARLARRIVDNQTEDRTGQREIVSSFAIGKTARSVEQPSVAGKAQASAHRSEPRKLPSVEVVARRERLVAGKIVGRDKRKSLCFSLTGRLDVGFDADYPRIELPVEPGLTAAACAEPPQTKTATATATASNLLMAASKNDSIISISPPVDSTCGR